MVYPTLTAEYAIAFSVLFGNTDFFLDINRTTGKGILMEELNFDTSSPSFLQRLIEFVNFECNAGYLPKSWLKCECVNNGSIDVNLCCVYNKYFMHKRLAKGLYSNSFHNRNRLLFCSCLEYQTRFLITALVSANAEIRCFHRVIFKKDNSSVRAWYRLYESKEC